MSRGLRIGLSGCFRAIDIYINMTDEYIDEEGKRQKNHTRYEVKECNCKILLAYLIILRSHGLPEEPFHKEILEYTGLWVGIRG